MGHMCQFSFPKAPGLSREKAQEGCQSQCLQRTATAFSTHDRAHKNPTAVAAYTRSVQDQDSENSSMDEAAEEILTVGGHWGGRVSFL